MTILAISNMSDPDLKIVQFVMEGRIMNRNQYLYMLAAPLCLLLLTGCSQSKLQMPIASTSEPATHSPAQYQYRIGAGDQLNIFVWRNPDLSGSFTVRPDGYITTSLVEDLKVSGKTSAQVAREMEQELAKYLREPVVTVIIEEFVGPYSEQVRVLGEAVNPLAINYRQGMTLLDVMIAVGGLTEFAAGNKASLVRSNLGQQKTYALRLDDLIRGGDIHANADILPGDIIIIPETWF
jgi:polysaccharide export outer membrane protein